MIAKKGLVRNENIIGDKGRVLILEIGRAHLLPRWLIQTQDLILLQGPITAKKNMKIKQENDVPDLDQNRDHHTGGVQEEMTDEVTIRGADVPLHLSLPENNTRDDD